jgi:hypothetical protein
LIIGIVAAVLLVLCGGAIACTVLVSNAGDDAADTTVPTANPTGGATEATAQPPPESAGLNQPVRDGKFEFTVTAVECGIAQVGNEILSEQAQGQFCKVSLTVKNIGNEAQMFLDANQYAFNAEGNKYEADSAAAIYLEEESSSFLENINPGNTVTGVILFDIPKDASIVKLELHDSAFSGGVTVNV